MYRKNKDVISGTVLAVLSVIYLAMSFQIKLTNIDRIVGSRMFPQICGTIILLLSISLIVGGVRKARAEGAGESKEKKSYLKTVIVLGSYAAYIFLMDKIGFTASSILYLFSQMVVMGNGRAGKKAFILYAVISVVASVAIYVMFNKVFLLMLPRAGWF